MNTKRVNSIVSKVVKSYGSDVKDLKESRPPRMARPHPSSGRGKYHLYIQDLLNDVLKDKYGEDRGEKTFQYLINLPNKAMYPAGQEITDEKAQMYIDLGEPVPSEGDYFNESYYSVWKRWIARGKPAQHLPAVPRAPGHSPQSQPQPLVTNKPITPPVTEPKKPISRHEISPSHVRSMNDALLRKLGLDRNAERVFQKVFIFTEGASNKYHFFAVYETQNPEALQPPFGKDIYVGGNAFGRIGSFGSGIEIAKGEDYRDVLRSVESKIAEKQRKGYQEVDFR